MASLPQSPSPRRRSYADSSLLLGRSAHIGRPAATNLANPYLRSSTGRQTQSRHRTFSPVPPQTPDFRPSQIAHSLPKLSFESPPEAKSETKLALAIPPQAFPVHPPAQTRL